MARAIKLATNILYKLAKFSFFMLFEAESSKIVQTHKKEDFVWSQSEGHSVVQGTTPDTTY